MAGSGLGLCRGLQASKRRDFPVACPAPGRRRRRERQQGGGEEEGKPGEGGGGEGGGGERGTRAGLLAPLRVSLAAGSVCPSLSAAAAAPRLRRLLVPHPASRIPVATAFLRAGPARAGEKREGSEEQNQHNNRRRRRRPWPGSGSANQAAGLATWKQLRNALFERRERDPSRVAERTRTSQSCLRSLPQWNGTDSARGAVPRLKASRLASGLPVFSFDAPRLYLFIFGASLQKRVGEAIGRAWQRLISSPACLTPLLVPTSLRDLGQVPGALSCPGHCSWRVDFTSSSGSI